MDDAVVVGLVHVLAPHGHLTAEQQRFLALIEARRGVVVVPARGAPVGHRMGKSWAKHGHEIMGMRTRRCTSLAPQQTAHKRVG